MQPLNPKPPTFSFTKAFLISASLAAIIVMIIWLLTVRQNNKQPSTTHLSRVSYDTQELPNPSIKHDSCIFKDARFSEVMLKVRGWYEVSCMYEGPINNRFTGVIPANASLNEVLQAVAEMGNIRFRRSTEGIITILP